LDRSTRNFLLFLFKLFIIWLSWKAFVFIIGKEITPVHERFFPAISLQWEHFNSWYKVHLLKVCVAALKLLGFPAWLYKGYQINIGNLNGVAVGNYCLGFQLMYYFSMLLAVSELNRIRKFAGIAAGFLMVNTLNIVRLCILALISAYYHSVSYIFHDYIFNLLVFGSLMLFYYWLLRKQ